MFATHGGVAIDFRIAQFWSLGAQIEASPAPPESLLRRCALRGRNSSVPSPWGVLLGRIDATVARHLGETGLSSALFPFPPLRETNSPPGRMARAADTHFLRKRIFSGSRRTQQHFSGFRHTGQSLRLGSHRRGGPPLFCAPWS